MVATLAVLCLVLALVVVLLVIEVWALPRRRHRVLVNLLHDEGTVEGLLWMRRGAWLVIKDARLHRSQGEAVQVDGEVLIHQAQIAFLQVP